MEALEFVRTLMWIVSAAVTLVTAGLGIILNYHWNKYSGSPAVARTSILTYTAVSVALILGMIGSIPL